MKIAPFDRALTSSYWRSIEPMSLSSTEWDISRYWSKITDFNLPPLFRAPWCNPVGISPISLATEN